ncbi:hypothetical protein QCA50_018252 [Cerrena zonata]|uniref:Fatty acid desaturase domain-containing protein n=1 Tax=Cerrena zonata TaxID=2478898 RepID=A0AAW0FDD9_9APHY
MFSDGPEYEARLNRPFTPPTATLKELHDAVPKHLLQKDPWRSFGYVLRDIVFCVLLFWFGASIDRIAHSGFGGLVRLTDPWEVKLLTGVLWLSYWWWQGLVFTSFFCIAHELGHGTLFHSWYANNIPGFLIDTFIMVPFFAWKASHNAHHKAVGSIERDENYVPYLRSDFKLPPQERARRADYAEVFDETPIMTVVRLFIMQGFGWWLYMGCNIMGSPMYPAGTNHFSPYSPLFKKEQRMGIFVSDLALLAMGSLLVYAGQTYGWKAVLMYYVIPYMLCNHWIVMCTFLHHSDPTIPHYRKEEWSFLRGAAATVDRPILGWMGRFFFHNVSHDHIAHHFFSQAPFCKSDNQERIIPFDLSWLDNQPQITQAIRSVLKEDYNYDSTNSLYALYRSFTECVFVEDEGGIVFYKNADGVASRYVADSELVKLKSRGWSSTNQDKLERES